MKLTHLEAGVEHGIGHLAPTHTPSDRQGLGRLVHLNFMESAKINCEAVSKAPKAGCVAVTTTGCKERHSVLRCQQDLRSVTLSTLCSAFRIL